MRIAVVGSSDFINKPILYWALERIFDKGKYRNIQIYSIDNFAKDSLQIGVSYFASEYAKDKLYPFFLVKTERFNLSNPEAIIDYDKSGNQYVKNAKILRNKKLLGQVHHLIIFHKNEPELVHILENAHEQKINVFEFNLIKLGY